MQESEIDIDKYKVLLHYPVHNSFRFFSFNPIHDIYEKYVYVYIIQICKSPHEKINV